MKIKFQKPTTYLTSIQDLFIYAFILLIIYSFVYFSYLDDDHGHIYKLTLTRARSRERARRAAERSDWALVKVIYEPFTCGRAQHAFDIMLR